ncbi:MAG: thymidine kinase [Bacilli bacterium]|nr:thymidine kinase [Bacilli bacterium]
MSKLYFRYGAMNCGKSTALLQTAYNYEQNNKTVILLKPKIDTKCKNHIESRLGINRKVDLLINQEDNILYMLNDLLKNNISCILVDESQFLLSSQIEDLWKITKLYNIPVICYGIKTNFKGELFEGSKRLLELADEFAELITICPCGKRAKFNARFVNGKFTTIGNDILIDGKSDEVRYVPMCGKCFLDQLNSNNNYITE